MHLDPNLLEVFRFLGIENELDKYGSFRFVDDRIEVITYEGLELKRFEIGEATDLDIERIATLLRTCEGMRKKDEIYELIYSNPFLIQIPTSLNHILLNRFGPSYIPHRTIARLWEQRVPYLLNKEAIIYKEQGHLVREPHDGARLLRVIKKEFYSLAFDMDSFSSQHNSGAEEIQKHTETVTLPNGDLIIFHFTESAEIIEISHMMK